MHRTLNLIESGITPVYVLEGKAPKIKSSELEKRQARREKLQEKISTAITHGDVEGAERFSKQLVHVNKHHIRETADLLGYLGIPVIQVLFYFECLQPIEFLTWPNRHQENLKHNVLNFVKKDKFLG